MGITYTVSDGKLMLILEPAEEGGYVVTSPLDPQLLTQAETLEEAFLMAYDARELLIQGRAELARRLLGNSPSLAANLGGEVGDAARSAPNPPSIPARSDEDFPDPDGANITRPGRGTVRGREQPPSIKPS